MKLLSIIIAGVVSCTPVCAEKISTRTVSSGQLFKATENVSFGIEDFGYPYLSFENAKESNANNIRGFNEISVWDQGKVVSIKISNATWQATRIRTTNGCIAGKRMESADFKVEVQEKVGRPPGGVIENSLVKLITVGYFPEYKVATGKKESVTGQKK